MFNMWQLKGMFMFMSANQYSFLVRLGQTEGDCHEDEYYDRGRMLCLDQCGGRQCTVDFYCSTRASWAEHIDPPICLNICFQPCDSNHYCNHQNYLCEPCDELCTSSDLLACRAYCFGKQVFIRNNFSAVFERAFHHYLFQLLQTYLME